MVCRIEKMQTKERRILIQQKTTTLRVLLIFTVLLLSAGAPSGGSLAEPVKIGLILAKTGHAAKVSDSSYWIARRAVKEINQKGGLLGNKVRLIEYDNQSTPLGARKAAGQAAKDGVHGVIGSLYSSHSLAAADVLEKEKIPMISPISTHTDLTARGEYIFRTCYTDRFQGKVLADFAKEELGAEKAAVLVNAGSRYSQGLADYFTSAFRSGTGEVVQLDYRTNATDFTAQLDAVKQFSARVAFIPGHFRESAFIVKQADAKGLKIPFIGGDGWLDRMYEYGGESIHGHYYISQWHKDIPREKSRWFVKKHQAMYGQNLYNEPAMALTYDAVMVFARAVTNAGSLNRKRIRESLSNIRGFKGVTGDITFNSQGDLVNNSAVILKFKDFGSVFHRAVQP